ncbi:DUF2905 domain-containing protein [Candidatus Bipolaricaulota bacterium]|nr:DUF2905 domain-containing protein [Candidatus Bipolaricaulota bacterium]MCF7891045.1 DUF2905 domain-containing protein [Candidatus Bipolaricaulota bacterium]
MFPLAKEFGRTLLFIGGFLIVVGLFFFFGEDIPFIGNLPGDFRFEKGNFQFYFPLGTAILISLGGTILINFIIWLINR